MFSVVKVLSFRDICRENHFMFSVMSHRPGFVRLNLPYFASEETRDFVVQAVKMVAQEAWKLLPQVRRYDQT